MKKITPLLSLLFSAVIFVMIKSANCQQITPISTIRLNDVVCIKKGRLLNGQVSGSPEIVAAGTICPNNSLAVNLGVISGSLVLTTGGQCLNSTIVTNGIIQVLEGDVVNRNNIVDSSTNTICARNVPNIILLNPSSDIYIQTYPSNTSLDQLLIIQDNPILINFNYNIVELNETICLESGIVLEGRVRNSVSSPQLGLVPSFESCSPNSVLLLNGVLDLLSGRIFTNATCMTRGKISGSRILVKANATVAVNQTMSNGKICLAEGSNGVVALPHAFLLIVTSQVQVTSTRYSRPSRATNDYTRRTNNYDRDKYKPSPYKSDVNSYQEREQSYEYERRPLQRYEYYIPPARKEEPTRNRDKPRRVDRDEYKRHSRFQIRQQIDRLADRIADKVKSKVMKKQRSKAYRDEIY